MSEIQYLAFEALLSEVPYFVAVKDPQSRRYVFVNEAFAELVRRRTDEVVGFRDEEIFSELWAEEARIREDHVLESGEIYSGHDVVVAISEERRTVTLQIKRSSTISDKGPMLVISGRDVTEQRLHAQGVEMEKELFRQVIDTDPNLIFVKDRYGNFVLVNEAVSKAFGMPIDALVNKSNRKVHDHEDELENFEEVDREVIRTMREMVVEEPFTIADGKQRWYRTIKRPLLRADGEVQILGISTDITAVRESNEAQARALLALEQKAVEAEKAAEAKAQLAEELDQRLSIIEEQNREILSLSVPMLDVGGSVLGVPVIGTMTAARAGEMMEKLLHAIVERRTRHVIIDLTGLESVDTGAADQLMRVVRAVGLLGAKTVVTGISPLVAQTIIGLGVDLSQISTMRTLREAIKACERRG